MTVTAEKTIGVGLVGVGLGSILLELNRDPETALEVRAMYDPDPERAFQRYEVGKTLKTLQDEFGVDALCDDYRILINREDIDVVAVFSPCPHHFEQARAALEAGKHVVVTKPMVTTMADVEALVQTVDRTGRKLLVAQSLRWNNLFMTLHDMFERGELGDVMFAEGHYMHDFRSVFDRSPWRYQLPQDLLLGGACHPIDLLRWFMGDVDEVFAYGDCSGFDSRYPADKEDTFAVCLKFTSGRIATLKTAIGIVRPPSHVRSAGGIGLYCTKASVQGDRIIWDADPEKKIQALELPRESHPQEGPRFMRHLEQCILGDAEPLVSVRDGARVVSTCLACRESMETGRPVKVRNDF